MSRGCDILPVHTSSSKSPTNDIIISCTTQSHYTRPHTTTCVPIIAGYSRAFESVQAVKKTRYNASNLVLNLTHESVPNCQNALENTKEEITENG